MSWIERRKNTKKETDLISRKKKKLEDNLILTTPILQPSSQIPLSHLTSLEFDNIIQDVQYNNNVNDSNNVNNETDGLLYGLDEVQEIISKQFQDAESLSKPMKIGFEIELDSRLVESTFPEFQPNACDLTTIKENFRQLVNILTLPIEYGSGYWDSANASCYKKKEFTGCATVHLGCTQWDDRKWQRPENIPVKRRSEARAPINRYACMGNIILTINPQKQLVLIQGSHQQAHEHPQYRKVAFPEEAKQ